MNEQQHWDTLAHSYNDEIFDVFANDRLQRLPHYFSKHARAHGTALDFGCGNGKAFPFLSPRFRHVIGMDISGELLRAAGQRKVPNVKLVRADLSRKNITVPKVEFVFSCNVIMLPEIEKNEQMFRNVANALKPGGAAVLVVPSLESALFTAWRMIELHRQEGTHARAIPPADLHSFTGHKRDILRGLLPIDRVVTKHYQEPELRVVLRQAGLHVSIIERLEYGWEKVTKF
ncbi:MAG: class I SAM-dependent methyltransferase [Cyclobacteriaceae bacterium]|nr:class I SAM-dependent methyltransferase [Cyclobacteriaceae bacterium]